MVQRSGFRDAGLVGGLATSVFLAVSVLLHWFSTPVCLLAIAFGVATALAKAKWARDTGTVEAGAATVPASALAWVGFGAVLSLQATLFAVLLVVRTDQGLSSPWQVAPKAVFILFGLGVWLLLLLAERLPSWALRFAWTGQLFFAFSVSAFVYRYGFGFDPFIHQAAARFLEAHGDIRLPSPLYVGQYAVEAALARLTGLSIVGLDRFLLPVLAAFFGAWTLPKAMRLWSKDDGWGWSWLMLLPSFLPFTFTVPYNLSCLGFLAVVVCLPHLAAVEGLPLAVFGLAFVGLLHPLLAMPVAALLCGVWIGRRRPRLAVPVAFGAVFLGIIGLFFLYVRLTGGVMRFPDVPSLSQAWAALTGFPFGSRGWPWFAKIYYGFFHAWLGAFCVLGWFGYRRLPAGKAFLRRSIVGAAFGTAAATLVLAASTRFKDIVSAEQFEFALRLRNAIPILFLPGVGLLCRDGLRRLSSHGRPVVFLILAAFMVAVWQVSYPQANRLVRRYTPGLGAIEVETFVMIERLTDGRPYVALTPQMVSAAALRAFGFERELQTDSGPRYPYAIPTGGELYGLYTRLWKTSLPVDLVLGQIFAFVNVDQAAVALPVALDRHHAVRDRLLPKAAEYRRINGVMDVYLFRKER